MGPKFGNGPIFVIEQGGMAEVAFNAMDRTIDSITETTIFSRYKLNLCGEACKD